MPLDMTCLSDLSLKILNGRPPSMAPSINPGPAQVECIK